MWRCVVVDDESGAIEILSGYVRKTPQLELTKTFRDSVEALTFLNHNDVDLVFLDIDMPNLNGMQLSELIRDKNIMVIFCTAYSEYAVESYEKEAVDYLLKPIAYERFLKAVTRAMNQNKTYATKITSENKDSTSKIFIKSGSKIHQLDIHNLLYMKKDGHYIVFHTTSGELLSRMNMTELLNTLPKNQFVRIHRSYVISTERIDTIEKHFVMIKNTEIPIGESYRKKFVDRIKYSGN